MKPDRLLASLAFLFCFAHVPLRAQQFPLPSKFLGQPLRPFVSDPAIERKVDALLKQMTLEEKIGQLVQYSAGVPTGPGTGRTDYEDMVAKGQVGSLFNIEDVHSVNRYQHLAVEKSRLHIPLLFGLDVIHGYRTIFPVPLALASSWDPPLIERAMRLVAEESSAAGVRWTFSPMVDISRDPRWGRIVEGEGEDPFLASLIARAYVRGYQGGNLGAPDSIAACAKHFAGYGAAEGGRDYNAAEISEHTLREVYLPPFFAALDEGAPTIMSSFNTLNGVPATANPLLLREILRDEWKFPGLTVTDFGSMRELIAHGVASDPETAATKAFLAGIDMDMESNYYHQYLLGLVKAGKVSEAQLDESVRHVLRVKFALGLVENPYTDESRENRGPLSMQSLELARAAAERSFVLLKNDAVAGRRVLPLSIEARTIALIGPLADDAGNMLGSWRGRGKPGDVVTVRAALAQKVGADHLRYAKGGDIQNATDPEIDEAVAAARESDVAVLALGVDAPEMTAEAASRAHLVLPGRQQELLEKVTATGKPLVLLLFSGRPLTLPWAFAHVPAVLAVWFPGVQAGPAITRTLFGETAPSGRLVVSWPRAVGQIPTYYNALTTGRPATNVDLTHPPRNAQEKYVSRYIDELNAPQFPFGFGLSYTEFLFTRPEISATKLSARELNEALRHPNPGVKAALTVSAEVSNSGNVAADEVAQLYVQLRGTSVAEPARALKGFERVSLAPGERKKVTFALSADSFALWDIQNELNVEPCHVRIWVSPDASQGESIDLDIVE